MLGGGRWNTKSRLRKQLPIFFLTRPSWPATALYAVPVVFGLVALLTKNPIFRTLVPLAVPLITFLGIAWWTDFRERRALLSEVRENADALLMTCWQFIERDIDKWRANPTTVSLMPQVTSSVWESITERAHSDASVRIVGRQNSRLSQIYARIRDRPIMTGTILRRASWSWDALAAPNGHPWDPHLPRNIFQCGLFYLGLAETLYRFLADSNTWFAPQTCREQGPWVVKARTFLKEADIAWTEHLVANPDQDAKERKAIFDKRLDELRDIYRRTT